MALFRRRKPLHELLAEAGHMSLGDPDPGELLSHPPGWGGRAPVTEPVLHGIPRPRRWDMVATATAPGLRGDIVHFVALPDGTLVVEEDEPDDALASLADVLDASVTPPYRAEAVRRSDGMWAVAASRIKVVEERGLDGEEVELTMTGGARTLVVDGERTLRRAPALETVGDATGSDYVVRARHLVGVLWEVEATPL